MNIHDHVREIIDLHANACDKLNAFAKPFTSDLPAPRCCIVPYAKAWAGRYVSHVNLCIYSLAYAVSEGSDYGHTIVHEVCHAYHNYLRTTRDEKSHGDLWKFLMLRVCNVAPYQYHKYDRERANAASDYLKVMHDAEPIMHVHANYRTIQCDHFCLPGPATIDGMPTPNLTGITRKLRETRPARLQSPPLKERT